LGKGSNTTTTSSQNTTHADPQADALYRQILERAQGAASTPYQAYQGELVAPMNAQQNLGISGINSGANFAQPYIQDAAGYARSSAAPITASEIQNYQSPYTQQVVDATQAQFDRSNAKGQTALKGNAISSNALGGNRVGVAQANLAGEQQAQQNPVIAGLYDKSYQTALAAAQADAQRRGTASYSLGNLGVAGQNAALTGAQSQVGAGTLQQQTQQAQDTAGYGQFTQAQGYPYQQLQWLAGLGTGVGSQLGGTASQTGTSTPPAPNYTSQLLGLGTAALGFLSDERAKEDVEEVGRLHDGQKIYRFRYKGDPRFQIGLIAQEAREHTPDAVHHTPAGLSVDYKTATDDAAEGRSMGGLVHSFAEGGGVAPWAEGKGWIPQAQIHGGQGAPSSAGSAPSPAKDSGMDPEKIAKQAMGLAQGFKDFKPNASLFGSSPTNILPQVAGFAPSANGAVYDNFGGGQGGFGGLYRDGGRVGFEDGGAPRIYDQDEFNPMDAEAGKPLTFGDRTAPAQEAIADGTWDPQGINYTDMKLDEGAYPLDKTEVASATQNGPTPRPASAGLGEPAPVMASGDDDGPSDVSARSAAPPSAGGVPSAQAGFANPYAPPAAMPEEEKVGLFLKMSPAVQAGLLATGLGLMSSRSPNLGNALGDAGIAGLGAYGGVKQLEAAKAKTAADLSRDAAKYANELKLKVEQQGETSRHNKASEANTAANRTPQQWRTNAKGELEAVPGGQYDPAAIALREKARAGAKAPEPSAASAIDSSITGPAYVAELEKSDPDLARAAKAVGDYRTSLTSLSQNRGYRERVLNAAARYNPEFDQTQYAAKSRARNNFAGGIEGRAVRSLNVSIDHLDTLQEAATAMRNGNFPILNELVNRYRTATGNPLATNFDSIKQVVSAEIAKAVVGGPTAVHDRDDMAKRARSAASPEQLAGMITEYQKLLAGQMKGLRRQYESQTKLKDFEEGLEPSTKRILSSFAHVGEGVGAKGTTSPPRPANVPPGSGYSQTQKKWRDPSGKLYNADGSPAQ
jgi:hypothetical protein